MMTLHKLFLNEVRENLCGVSKANEMQLLKQEDLAGLPPSIKNYLKYCAYLDKPKYENLFIAYDYATIKLKPDQDWLPISCQQLNSVRPPTRLAYMKGHLFKLLPIEARDKYQNGHGNMLIKLAGITLSNSTGKEMDTSALITYLAEAPLLPAAILSPTIAWTETEDANRVQASISAHGITAQGEFFLNEQNQIIRFESADRYYSENGKSYSKMKWSALYDRYQERNGVRVPTVVRAVWHLPDGQEYEYFRAVIKEMKYNLEA